MNKQEFLSIINPVLDTMLSEASAIRPMLFTQEPFRGTIGIVMLHEIFHPSDTIIAMDKISDAFHSANRDVCIIANDLTTLEINEG